MTFKNFHIKFSPRFGNFPAIISLNKLSAFFSLSFPSESPIILKLILLMVPKYHFYFILFYPFFLLSSNWIILNFLYLISQILSSVRYILFLILSIALFISILTVLNFYDTSIISIQFFLLWFLFLCWNSHFVLILFSQFCWTLFLYFHVFHWIFLK